jgi:hypothetical protein
MFRDLQESHSFAPLQNQKVTQFFVKLFAFFHQISSFSANFESISTVFEQILMKICQNFTVLKNVSQFSDKSQLVMDQGYRGCQQMLKKFRRNPRFSGLGGTGLSSAVSGGISEEYVSSMCSVLHAIDGVRIAVSIGKNTRSCHFTATVT